MTDSSKTKKIFSGLEHLGFNKTEDLKLYDTTKSKSEDKKAQADEISTQKALLYEKSLMCPVCSSKFSVKAVKNSAPRMVKKDSDFFIRYSNINPYFYDVWLCNICGYAAMKSDFGKIKEHQIEKVQQNISLKWKGRKYPDIFDVSLAIERYKLSLLNYCVMEAKSSSKAMNCLKLAWMHRLSEDSEKELLFLQQALEGFSDAYYNEDFPIYGMDRFTTMYLMGELNRRLSTNEQALIWFSKVITTPSVPQKLKEMARDQKDIIKDILSSEKSNTEPEPTTPATKTGLFSRIFK
jgi:uncharacterized protein